MKRIMVFMVVCLLLLSGCGGQEETSTNKAAVTLGDVTVTLGEALTQEQLDALGNPVDVQEAPSCHYEGMDTVRQYDGFSLQTYRQGDADILCVAVITGNPYPTDKNVAVGSTAQAVRDAYGTPVEDTEYYLVYDLTADVTLTFELEGDAVSAILYELKA